MVINYLNLSKNKALGLFFNSFVSYVEIEIGDLEIN
jgi:hypothetical protein